MTRTPHDPTVGTDGDRDPELPTVAATGASDDDLAALAQHEVAVDGRVHVHASEFAQDSCLRGQAVACNIVLGHSRHPGECEPRAAGEEG